MISLSQSIALLVLASGASAQAAALQQCGGSDWSGATSCVSSYYCKFQNDYYHQCVPGIARGPFSSAKPVAIFITTPSSTKAAPVTTASSEGSASGCTGTFTPVSASAYIAKLNPGWNLGNTLDAVENEGDWNNSPVVESTFDDIKAAGFKGIRLPVTWAYHFTGSSGQGDSPFWNLDPVWLQRVSDVTDMITQRGFQVIVNFHHDSWIWADVTKIGTKLACKSSLVSFEPINEPPGTTANHGAEINKLNNIFLKAINDAGGFNSQRVVTLVGAGEDSIKTSQWFKRPDSTYTNPYAIQYHYYSPYDYIFSAWGKTTWGSDADKATLENDFKHIRQNFTDIPLLIGEWAASPVMTESAARWKYFDFLVRTAAKYNTPTILWDNGNDFLDRDSHKWRDPVAVNILMKAAAGVPNSLAESTVDPAAISQFSSACLFHKVGEGVNDTSVSFQLNGNTLESAKVDSTALFSGEDYSVSGSNIVFKAAFLSKYLSATAAPGSKANVTVSFSAGADSNVEIVQWDTPTVSSASSQAVAGADFLVPATWKGVRKPAAVRALRSDGTYLVDDWTQYLGPLQQARTTFGNQFNWDWNLEGVQLTSGAVQSVIDGGKDVTFTIEAYPRVPGNSVNFTLTV